ncbi:MAG: AmmeMemoRadiSam system protein B [Candidatus Omnitrophica bacterium]|nr:AmmeMemoRadiSam system protein B [Candidatus Omnitrophota bacterium]MBU4488946.1 AmmeMemoRadiSam system protein B [Candidatus Omnitrophota bacterium]MCG2705242.1 AmmeMemoRadiSam system protein B [Candidatus Omnitrophota bacterium]
MKKIILIILFIAVSFTAHTAEVKDADLAGSWYPASSSVLSSTLDSYLKEAKVSPVKGDVVAIIAPHAGLVYSGPVAAYAYKAIQGRDYKTVVLLGFCHRAPFRGISIYKDGYFNTPLGAIEVDSDFASKLMARVKEASFYPQAFTDENSVEMQLLFIKKVLPGARIVPIAFGGGSFANCETLASALADMTSGRDDILIVASTDMSHYHTERDARKIDLASVELLRNFAAKEIYDNSVKREQIFCGYMPVATVLLAARKIGAGNIEILQYANSGNITGDMKSVVGYVSAVIYKDSAVPGDRPGARPKGGTMLNDLQRKTLLKIARDTIESYLKTGNVLQAKENDPVLNKEMGGFVTLHKKGQLRGCIGNIIGKGPLYLTVRDMAIESATGDPRFPKVTLGEMKDIDIEISVLSELEKVKDINEIQMGVHGVLVRKGFNSGVFLPQVATETGWTKDEFMTNLCSHKAGLLPDAWKYGDVDIYIFTAEVFGEKE